MTTYTNSCLTCAHENLSEIDTLLRATPRLPFAVIAQRHGLDRQTVSRHHRKGHVVPDPDASTPPDAPVADSDDPLVVARDILKGLRAVKVSTLPPSARAVHYAEMRKWMETIRRMDPAAAIPKAVTMEEVEGLADFMVILAEVLEPHAAVRRELLRRLKAANLTDVLG